MKTFLFDKVIFGPIASRRLGISLGVNLLPLNRKFCNFDCIYCECGLNEDGRGISAKLPTREMVFSDLEHKFQDMIKNHAALDVITFAGNGEPTLHPDFKNIIKDTMELRNTYFPKARVSVLSNATMLHNQDVLDALALIDQNILKLDSGILETILCIDRPTRKFDLEKLTGQLQSFNGKLIIQTMFVRGMMNGKIIDNTTESEISALKLLLGKILPEKVMIYSLDRNTAVDGLEKIPVSKLKQIAADIELLGIEVQVAG